MQYTPSSYISRLKPLKELMNDDMYKKKMVGIRIQEMLKCNHMAENIFITKIIKTQDNIQKRYGRFLETRFFYIIYTIHLSALSDVYRKKCFARSVGKLTLLST